MKKIFLFLFMATSKIFKYLSVLIVSIVCVSGLISCNKCDDDLNQYFNNQFNLESYKIVKAKSPIQI